MKKSILLATMSVLFLIGLTSMTLMDPPYNATDCQDDCELFVEIGLFPDQGSCSSACATCQNPSSSVATFAVCQCNLLDDLGGGIESVGFSNFGQCVNWVKDFINGN